MLVQVKYREQQKYVKLDGNNGWFDFMLFYLKVIERFCLPPEANVSYKDATGTEVDAEIFSDLVGQGNVVLTVFSSDEFSDYSSTSETSDSSASTVILDESVLTDVLRLCCLSQRDSGPIVAPLYGIDV
ncbi:hypothetical protein F2P79_006185 [Pimephales promelas]|nr:hypothetical protein F2P79_006185 [Pimephales promelas]